jgi:uncharacterized membrane protein YphA (DoxX/SURF4 family)
MNKVLWTLQILLGLFFVLASGAPKLFLPIEALPMPIPIPPAALKLIGTLEVLGGLGVMLPGLTRIQPGLAPLAALGLTLTAIGGAIYQLMAGELGNAIFALIIALLCAVVAYGRWQLVPHRARSSANDANARSI